MNNSMKKERQRLLDLLGTLTPGTTEYAETLRDLTGLASIDETIKVDRYTIGILGNFVSLLTVLNYERLNVLTSKAMSYVIRR